MGKKCMKPLYVYKDTFLSGWGGAPTGSYVVANDTLENRKEFIFLKRVCNIKDLFPLVSKSGADVEYWSKIREHKYTSHDKSLVIKNGKVAIVKKLTPEEKEKRGKDIPSVGRSKEAQEFISHISGAITRWGKGEVRKSDFTGPKWDDED